MRNLKNNKTFLWALPVALLAQIGCLCALAAPDLSREDADIKESGQVLEDSHGNDFMEEVVSDKPKPKLQKIPIDLSRVGVSVDPHGNIVPIKDNASDPWAGSGVKPFYNHIETSTTLPYTYGVGYPGYGYPGYGFPGYGYPGFNRFGGYGYGAAGYAPFGYPGYGSFGGFGGYGGYGGLGYGGFGGFGPSRRGLLGAALAGAGAALYSQSTGLNPAFNPAFNGPFQNPLFSGGYGGFGGYGGYGGYVPLGGGYATVGNSATFLSNDLTTGAPIPQNSGSNSASVNTNSSGSVTPLPWLTPTTSYQQNSMWKAFNLGF